MNIEIRKIKYEDLEDVARINVIDWKKTYKGIIDDEFLNSLSVEQNLEKKKNTYQEHSFIVATIYDKVVGFCVYTKNDEYYNNQFDGEIKGSYVDYDLKRQGIGKKLINYALNDLKSQGKKKIYLFCLKDNINGRKFYETMGGRLFTEKKLVVGNKEYMEVGYLFES